MELLDLLNKYVRPSEAPLANATEHFDTVAQQAPPQQLGGGIAAAFRSDATPAFGQAIASLFGQSNPEQKAGALNHLLEALGPSAAAVAGGGLLQRLGLSGGSGPISPAQASQISAADVSAIATHAEQQNGSIVDKLGSFYAQHPTLVKTLGVAALGAVMSHMSKQRSV
jgi:hypothetical protein